MIGLLEDDDRVERVERVERLWGERPHCLSCYD